MKLLLEFNNDWVESLDISHIEFVAQRNVDEYFKRKRDFDCFAYQGGLELDLDILDIEYLANNYYTLELSCDTIKIKN